MRGWLLDTNVDCVPFRRGGAPSVKAWAAGQDEARLFLSVLTLGEYDKGIHRLPDDDPRRGPLRRGSRRHPGAVRRPNPARKRSGASAIGGLIGRMPARAPGHPPSVIDTLLAATAIEARLYLVTRNTKDVRLAGAVVFNPWDRRRRRFSADRRSIGRALALSKMKAFPPFGSSRTEGCLLQSVDPGPGGPPPEICRCAPAEAINSPHGPLGPGSPACKGRLTAGMTQRGMDAAGHCLPD